MPQIVAKDNVSLIKAMMNNERIIGILIYTVLRGELTNEVMELARSVPKEYYHSLGEEWIMIAKFVHTLKPLPMDDESLEYVQDMLRMEIAPVARWYAEGRPESLSEESVDV
jgi:hypothetical protein